MEGDGTLTWPDGKRYEGQYYQDKKHGQGTFYWPNGHIYTGGWKNGKQDGEGSLTKHGDTKVYLWKGGKRIKELISTPGDTMR